MSILLQQHSKAEYFPLAHGRYDVAPGLRPLGFDFGNADKDRRLFQIDQDFYIYHQQKELSKSESSQKYYPVDHQVSESEWHPIIAFMIDRLASEYPDLFSVEFAGSVTKLKCHLTKELLHFDNAENLKLIQSSKYRNAFDALAFQVQEDLALWRMQDDKEWLGAVHLSFPNHWDPAEKVGRSFLEVHAPVADFEKIKPISAKLVKGMIENGPFVRFAWGVATDNLLNHHPSKPGRHFDPLRPKLFLRIERQTLHPFPDVGSSLFSIRTYFMDCQKLSADRRASLMRAIQSMSDEALKYKGLSQSKSDILLWLSQL